MYWWNAFVSIEFNGRTITQIGQLPFKTSSCAFLMNAAFWLNGGLQKHLTPPNTISKHYQIQKRTLNTLHLNYLLQHPIQN